MACLWHLKQLVLNEREKLRDLTRLTQQQSLQIWDYLKLTALPRSLGS
jgi:hypothetical protein